MNTRYTRRVTTEKSEADAEIFLMQNGYKADKEGFGVYRRGLGFFGSPSFISIEVIDKKAVISAWKKHAILPGVFAFDVNRRGRRIERMADRLAQFMDCELSEEVHSQNNGALSVISLTMSVVGLAAWLIPAVGLLISCSGLATSITANANGKNNIAVLSRLFAVFGVTAATSKFVICLIK